MPIFERLWIDFLWTFKRIFLEIFPRKKFEKWRSFSIVLSYAKRFWKVSRYKKNLNSEKNQAIFMGYPKPFISFRGRSKTGQCWSYPTVSHENNLLKLLPSIFPRTFNFDETFSLAQVHDIISPEQSHYVWRICKISQIILEVFKSCLLFDKEKQDIPRFYHNKILRRNFKDFRVYDRIIISSSQVECSFSQLKMNKTDRRNLLKDGAFGALMLNKYYQINFNDELMKKKVIKKEDEISNILKEDSENDRIKRLRSS